MEYLSLTKTNKIIRNALKEAFPNFKGFSVRGKSYAGGASTTVYWTDGPRVADVEEIVKKFEGATFDPMQDLKEARHTTFEGKTVSFGADYVFTFRKNTDQGIEKAIKALKEKFPANFADFTDQITVENFRNGNLCDLKFFGEGTPVNAVYNEIRQLL